MKKLIALLLALVMVLGLGTVALADGTAANPEVKATDAESLATILGATDSGNTVTMDKDYTGHGIAVQTSGEIILDMNGHTITFNTGEGSGSGAGGTRTCGFQLLSGTKMTIKNGTITSELVDRDTYPDVDEFKEVKLLIQNHADELTLDGVTLDGTQTEEVAYVLSNDNGETLLTGGTVINSLDGVANNGWTRFAFDVDSKSNSRNVKVIVEDAEIYGDIEYTVPVTGTPTATLEIKDSAVLTGEISVPANLEVEPTIITPSGTITKPGNGGGFGIDTADCDLDVAHLELGESYGIPGAPTNKNWKVSTKWTKGGAMVEGISWNKDNGRWELTLKENYTISTAKDLEGTITFTGKGDNKGRELEVNIAEYVSNHLFYVEGVEKEDIADTDAYEAANNTIYVCDEDAPGYVKFNDKALLSCTLNMAAKEKAFMYNDESMIEALEEKFPEADIECYNFGGQPTFKNAAKFTLQADYADQYYIYSYTNGKLVSQDAEWDSIEGVYTWETKSPTSYVISDVELVAAAEADFVTKNPDTGANDVVGIAAALAVVSLAAAAAVSLKK